MAEFQGPVEHEQMKLRVRIALANSLRAARSRFGLSQEQTAIRAGLSTFAYHRLEQISSNDHAAANPTLETLLRVCAALNLDLAETVTHKANEGPIEDV